VADGASPQAVVFSALPAEPMSRDAAVAPGPAALPVQGG
jgi:hypothetical protein